MTEDILIIQLNRQVSTMQLEKLRKAIVEAIPEQRILLANGVNVEWAIITDGAIGADDEPYTP